MVIDPDYLDSILWRGMPNGGLVLKALGICGNQGLHIHDIQDEEVLKLYDEPFALKERYTHYIVKGDIIVFWGTVTGTLNYIVGLGDE